MAQQVNFMNDLKHSEISLAPSIISSLFEKMDRMIQFPFSPFRKSEGMPKKTESIELQGGLGWWGIFGCAQKGVCNGAKGWMWGAFQWRDIHTHTYIPRYMQIFGFHLLCVSSALSFSTIDFIEKCWVPRNKAKTIYVYIHIYISFIFYVDTQPKLVKLKKKESNKMKS